MGEPETAEVNFLIRQYVCILCTTYYQAKLVLPSMVLLQAAQMTDRSKLYIAGDGGKKKDAEDIDELKKEIVMVIC